MHKFFEVCVLNLQEKVFYLYRKEQHERILMVSLPPPRMNNDAILILQWDFNK
jgi:hypothetical protein